MVLFSSLWQRFPGFPSTVIPELSNEVRKNPESVAFFPQPHSWFLATVSGFSQYRHSGDFERSEKESGIRCLFPQAPFVVLSNGFRVQILMCLFLLRVFLLGFAPVCLPVSRKDTTFIHARSSDILCLYNHQ